MPAHAHTSFEEISMILYLFRPFQHWRLRVHGIKNLQRIGHKRFRGKYEEKLILFQHINLGDVRAL